MTDYPDYGAQLVGLLKKDDEKLKELAKAATAEGATLRAHQDYNSAFDKSRKEFELEAAKIQNSIEDQLKKSETEIDAANQASTTDKNVTSKLKLELATLQDNHFALQEETKKLAADGDAENAIQPSSQELNAVGDKEIHYFTKAYDTLATIKSLTFQLRHKTTGGVSSATAEEVAAIEATVGELESEAHSGLYLSEDTLKEVKASLASLQAIVNAATGGEAAIGGDSTEARLKVTTALDEFLKESSTLLQWCRMQKTELEALTEPDHIQTFSSALASNYTTMEENFNTLCEMGQQLLPNATVEKTLIECNEVWLNLQIYAHEVLQHTILEIHARSKLEDEVRAFSSYSTRFHALLKEVKEMLSLPLDDESKEVVQGALQQTEQLTNDFTPHLLLSDHLKEFSLRMECIRDNYTNLRRTTFGRLTFLSQQQLPLLNSSHRRREEYLGRMKDLKQWVDKKDLGESCADIHSRVMKIKSLIDTEYEHVQRNPTTDVSEAVANAPVAKVEG